MDQCRAARKDQRGAKMAEVAKAGVGIQKEGTVGETYLLESAVVMAAMAVAAPPATSAPITSFW